MEDKENKRKQRVAQAIKDKKIVDDSSFAVFQMIEDLHERLDKEVPTLATLIDKVKGEKGDAPTSEELLELITPLIPEPIKPEDGKDYVLTDKDKKDIAKSIPVPIVEKEIHTIVEKTDVIHEKPIITENIVEKAMYEEPNPIVDKINKATNLIDNNRIKGFSDLEKLSKMNAFNPTMGPSFSDLANINRRIDSISTTGSTITSVSNSDGTLTISPTTGAVVASLALGNANLWTGVQTFSSQATTQSPVSGSTSQFVGLDANPLRITFDTHNNASASGTALMFRRSRGTAATPTATQSGDVLGSFNGRGYGTSQYAAASTGVVALKANENFTNTANGTYFSIDTTPDGSVTAAEAFRVTGAKTLITPGYTTNGGILYTNGSGLFTQTGAGIATTVLHGGTTPSYSAVALTTDVSGTLPIANGGTNNTTLTTNGINYFDGTSITNGSLFTFNGTTVSIPAASLTGASATSILSTSQTWNTSGAPTAFLMNIANTASASASKFLDFQIGGIGKYTFGINSFLLTSGASGNSATITVTNGTSMVFLTQTPTAAGSFQFNSAGALTNTSGSYTGMAVNGGSITANSGTATHTALNVIQTVNQTVTASGVTRGIFINPTLTVAVDYRALETTGGSIRIADTYIAGSGSLAGTLLNMTQTWNTSGAPTAIKLNVTNTASGAASLFLDFQIAGTSQFSVSKAGVTTWVDAANLVFGTTTGTKIGTATTQKIGFWNVTPIVQPASANQAAVATTAATNVAPYGFTTAAQADAIVTLVNQLRSDLVAAGLIKGSA